LRPAKVSVCVRQFGHRNWRFSGGIPYSSATASSRAYVCEVAETPTIRSTSQRLVADETAPRTASGVIFAFERIHE
jgi:hypothetical protein